MIAASKKIELKHLCEFLNIYFKNVTEKKANLVILEFKIKISERSTKKPSRSTNGISIKDYAAAYCAASKIYVREYDEQGEDLTQLLNKYIT